MLLFLISLLVGVIGSAALYLAFSRSLERNNARHNKRAVSYLAPVFLSFLLVIFAVFFTIPRLQDLVFLISGNLEVHEIELKPNEIHWLTIEVEAESYVYNRFKYEPLPTTSYQITALPKSRHILSLELIAGDTTDGGENETE